MNPIILAGMLALSPQQVDTSFTVRAGGTLQLDNWAGRVQVRSWDQTRMRVRTTRTTETEIEIEVEGATVRIDVNPRRGHAQPVDFEITVPRRFGLEIDGVNMEADVQGLEGDVTIETVNGAVSIRNVTGRIDAQSTQGLVTVADSRGRLSAETVNDGIRVTNHEGDITVEAINGPVFLQSIRASSVDATTTNGEIRYDGEVRGEGRYSLASHNGDLTFAMPAGAGATFSVDTFNGEIDADFPIELRGTRDRRSMTFTVGDGGARVELASFGGMIHLRTSASGRR